MTSRLPAAEQRALLEAEALISEGKLSAAEAIYRDLLAGFPAHAGVLINLAYLCGETGRETEEIELLSKALAVQPHHPDALLRLGDALLQQGELAASISCLRAGLDLAPDDADALFNLGWALHQQGELDQAIHAYNRALGLTPHDLELLVNLGHALMQKGDLAAAIATFRQALTVQPDQVDCLSDLGMALRASGELEQALAAYDQALRLEPNHLPALYNRANALSDRADRKSAIAAYEQVLVLQPGHSLAHWNLSLLLLGMGDYGRGWDEYEWRWKTIDANLRPLVTSVPVLCPGQRVGSLLIWSEQGVGDQLMFCSMLPQASQLAERLLVQVDARLLPLLSRSLPSVKFVDRSLTIPDSAYQAHLPMGSLGRFLRRSAADFPADQKGYLHADQQRTRRLRGRLSPAGDVVIGLSWKSLNGEQASRKSMALQPLAAAVAGPGIRLVCLQYGAVSEEIASLKASTGIELLRCQDVDPLSDLDGLAALISACDLVITTSNSTAHLAAGLGKTTWVLLGKVSPSQWRWGAVGHSCAWYSSVEIFRQSIRGDWSHVLEELQVALAKELADIRSCSNPSPNPPAATSPRHEH